MGAVDESRGPLHLPSSAGARFTAERLIPASKQGLDDIDRLVRAGAGLEEPCDVGNIISRRDERFLLFATTPDLAEADVRQQSVADALAAARIGGARLTSVEITANEWRAAQEHGPNYILAIVTQCRSKSPRVELISDPFSLATGGSATAEPTAWRFALCE